MKNLKVRMLLPIVFIFTLFSCSPDPLDKMSVDTSKAKVSYNYSDDETALAGLINDYRASIGLNKLDLVNYVSVKSEEHDLYMIQTNDVGHAQFQERADDIMKVLGAYKVNENVAYNYATSESVLKAWLDSAGHRANIEGDFSQFGISIRINPATGKKYYTNIFIKE